MSAEESPFAPALNGLHSAMLITVFSSVAVLILFWPIIHTLVQAWSTSRTFAHGFLVIPASFYLCWCFRDRLARPVGPSAEGMAMLMGMSAVWAYSYSIQWMLGQQVAVLAMVPTLIWTILGTEAVRVLAYPLGFLVFALPLGTATEPLLQRLTTTLAVAGLQLTGIAVAVDQGIFIHLSSKTWEVVPDCGGLRYLLPGLALGYLYAGLIYRTAARRFLFLLSCAIVLLFANGVRAYAIMVTDHLGIVDGADHRFYSYSIYGIAVLLLFWLGGQWKESSNAPARSGQRPRQELGQSLSIIGLTAIGAVGLLALVFVATVLLSTSAQAVAGVHTP